MTDPGANDVGSPRPERDGGVTAYVASINTAAVTELCVRTMHRFAGHPFTLVVGDCGSTDGSLEMLRTLAAEGRLHLEVAPEGRRHPDWLDRWYRECPTRYLVFADSDVEFRRPNWLHEMVGRAEATGAALVATRIQARGGVPYRHPVTGAEATLAERPEPWLMLLDLSQLRGRVDTSFAYREEAAAGAAGKVAFDTSAAFFRDLQRAGLSYAEMPPRFARAYHHYGSMSWQRGADRRMPLARRLKQTAKRARVALALRLARRATPAPRSGAP